MQNDFSRKRPKFNFPVFTHLPLIDNTAVEWLDFLTGKLENLNGIIKLITENRLITET